MKVTVEEALTLACYQRGQGTCLANNCMAWDWVEDALEYTWTNTEHQPNTSLSYPVPPKEGVWVQTNEYIPSPHIRNIKWARPRENRLGSCGVCTPRVAEISTE